MHTQPLVPARSCTIFPSAPSSTTVAFLAMSAGAALSASFTFASGDMAVFFMA